MFLFFFVSIASSFGCSLTCRQLISSQKVMSDIIHAWQCILHTYRQGSNINLSDKVNNRQKQIKI